MARTLRRRAHATTRRRVGERVWAALYQQKPRPPEGGVWQRAWITDHRITTAEFGGLDMARVIVAVDPAGGESASGDETVCIGAARCRRAFGAWPDIRKPV
ncbi:hypothetical protein ABT187_46125 [Streptomyces sp. NPDC001817]|uniref:hypothetical protein n=1 Tax=Streptomyces sp. NPDC001817 TaxID=3154398 RepID=UPI003318178A